MRQSTHLAEGCNCCLLADWGAGDVYCNFYEEEVEDGFEKPTFCKVQRIIIKEDK